MANLWTSQWEKPVPFNPNNVIFHEKKYVGCKSSVFSTNEIPVFTLGLGLTYQFADYVHVIDALREGRLRPEAMITRKISINRIVEDGFETLIHDKDKHVKIMVDLSDSQVA
jgi:threonine dehydrogenase-like Zn-dependent dehydrogenase